MTNLLRNPALQGFTLGTYFTSADGNTGTIEHPHEWEFIGISHEPDPQMLPASLHRDQGFSIAAGWRRWEGGYVQHNVPLQSGQRYLMKAALLPNVSFAHNAPDPTVIGIRFKVESGGTALTQDWQAVTYGQYQEPGFVFESALSGMASFQFWARSVWASNSCELQIFAFVLEPIAADGALVPTLGGVAVPVPPPVQAAPPPAPVAPVAPVPPAAPMGQPAAPMGQPAAPMGQPAPQPIGQRGGTGGSMGSGGVIGNAPPATLGHVAPVANSLEEVLTNDDIAVIVDGLRAMPQITNHPTILQGMERLAQVLERLRKA